MSQMTKYEKDTIRLANQIRGMWSPNLPEITTAASLAHNGGWAL